MILVITCLWEGVSCLKRIIIIVLLSILCAAALFGKVSLVGAAPGSNPNFISKNALQDSMNVIYKDLDVVRDDVQSNSDKIDEIITRLDAIEANLGL